MCKRVIFLTLLVLVLSLVLPGVSRAAHPDPVAWWKLDGDVLDSSGNDHHGTLHGNPMFVPGAYDEALEFDGDDYVTMDGYKGVVGDGTDTPAWSVTAWVRTNGDGEIVGWGSSGGGNRMEFRINNGRTRAEGGGGNTQGDTTISDGQWHHIAMTVAPNSTYNSGVNLYLDGVLDTRTETDPDPFHPIANFDVIFGQRYNQSNSRWYTGAIDDVRIYDKELTLEEIQEAMAGIGPVPPGAASLPNPQEEATDVSRDVALNWTPGPSAQAVNGHIVYLSESFEDVNNSIGGVTHSAASYAPPQRLDFNTTYYWRVDEVGPPPSSTVYRGLVWSFTTEPVGYPVDGVNITATASSTGQADFGPEKTIDGSGLDANDLHSTEALDMWLSGDEPQGAWIQYEFDRVYRLYEMWVWNSNQVLEALFGFGFKDVTVEYSTNGVEWTALDGVSEFAQAPGTDGYAHNTVVDFGGAAAKYVKLTGRSNWGGGILPQYGLSEVRFFSIPVSARKPSPESGATDVDIDGTLSWRAGREAAAHDVYLSTDEQAVIDGNAPIATVTDASYSPLPLDLASAYYWRVDEVNDAETPTTWPGEIWSFRTQEYFVVDDFESYNDIPAGQEGSRLVYEIWLDGLADPSKGGSQIGYFEGTSLETNTVYDGQQSVPFFYDNTVAAYSEVTVNPVDLQAGPDWTKQGVKALTLRFHGDPNNSVTERMYVKVNGSKVTYDGDAENLARAGWQMWYIDLTSIGVSLNNVTELSIGIERTGAMGGQGVILLDSLRLYAYDRQLVTPTNPGATGLQAHYEFEGTFDDSSGNARHGIAQGTPTFVAGKVGQAVELRGVNDYVQITGYKGIEGPNAFSISTWLKPTYIGDPQEIVYFGTHADGQRCEFRVHTNGRIRMGSGAGQIESSSEVTDGGWHHVAVTIKENATNSTPDVQIYIDGLLDSQEAADPDVFDLVPDWDVTIGYRPSQQDRFFNGQIDDVRIYDRVLLPGEAAWLAGRTQPFDKPF